MAVIPIKDRNLRLQTINNFAGGFAMPPRNDNEAAVMDNFEINRAGYLVTRKGVELYNSTSLGSGIAVGIGVGTAGSLGKLLFVAKSGTSIYYRALGPNYPAAFTAITCPDTGDHPVTMEPAEGNKKRYMVFACPNWDGVYTWDGVAAALVKAADSPAKSRYVRLAGQRVYAAGDDTAPYTIRFSNPGDPTAWPTGDEFQIPASRGRITGLERQSGVLIIFTERAILQLSGDPPDNFKVLTIHENIGCPSPNTISTVGAVTAFHSGYGLMTLSGGIESFGDKMDEWYHMKAPTNLSLPNSARTWGVLTPDYYFYRVDQETAANPPGTGRSEKILVYERKRFQAWFRFEYPITAGLGSLNPTYCPMIWDDEARGLVIAGGDGNLYIQRFHAILDDLSYTWNNDHPDIAVGSTFTTRYLDFGDPAMQKGWRRVTVSGQGSGGVTLELLDLAGNKTSAYVAGGTLPVQGDSPSIETTGRSSLFSYLRVRVSGSSMVLKNIDLLWRPARLSGRKLT